MHINIEFRWLLIVFSEPIIFCNQLVPTYYMEIKSMENIFFQSTFFLKKLSVSLVIYTQENNSNKFQDIISSSINHPNIDFPGQNTEYHFIPHPTSVLRAA